MRTSILLERLSPAEQKKLKKLEHAPTHDLTQNKYSQTRGEENAYELVARRYVEIQEYTEYSTRFGIEMGGGGGFNHHHRAPLASGF